MTFHCVATKVQVDWTCLVDNPVFFLLQPSLPRTISIQINGWHFFSHARLSVWTRLYSQAQPPLLYVVGLIVASMWWISLKCQVFVWISQKHYFYLLLWLLLNWFYNLLCNNIHWYHNKKYNYITCDRKLNPYHPSLLLNIRVKDFINSMYC